MTKNPPIEFEIPKELDEVFVTGIFGALTPLGGNLMFFVEDPVFDTSFGNQLRMTHIRRKAKLRVRMSPTTFKSISKWMESQLKNYESNFGEIGTVQNSHEQTKQSTDFQ